MALNPANSPTPGGDQLDASALNPLAQTQISFDERQENNNPVPHGLHASNFRDFTQSRQNSAAPIAGQFMQFQQQTRNAFGNPFSGPTTSGAAQSTIHASYAQMSELYTQLANQTQHSMQPALTERYKFIYSRYEPGPLIGGMAASRDLNHYNSQQNIVKQPIKWQPRHPQQLATSQVLEQWSSEPFSLLRHLQQTANRYGSYD